VAEWVARVYRAGSRYRVVIWGVLNFEVDSLDGIVDETAARILDHMRLFLPTHGTLWVDPSVERIMDFAIGVLPVRGDSPITDAAGAKEQLCPSRPSRR
jgi:hypothetical protein